ncbi:MAG: AlpA family phage regulatory protein [Motiliproteus sp.]|nr:AlpA family phage regulatory protein [Motiliproteus sp.]MCW9051445.1 AlpA family phage regulatory protein [Motiliproteus sp.]
MIEGKRFMSAKEVVARAGVSRTTIWRMQRKGVFPKKRQLSDGRVGWLASDVYEWIDSREG